ncbi:dienelactone hydrolase family protein [Massilia sp. R2A-15]|uniref:dienelactone hydrolase family protein n=1 Tax=Massilia sp. R2A-15 TaxID=3064278 RepID=UPI0027372BF2|nr:dienelactone hydrolase family protein [Massilia sp. R2A-15]WLI90284.1 dienelactone hydrolase family protein [Massilia sp. R2A-15]
MSLRPFLILLAIAGSAQAALPNAVTPDLMPDVGPHAVGLRVVQQYDYSRVLDAPVDAFGNAGNVGPARPIQTLVWYPAKNSTGAHMQVADYRQASLADVDFSLSGADAAKQRAAWMAGPQKAQYGASTLAIRDAAPAAGKFPVVIYAPSFASFAQENLDLCEYLASHGYVVIASRSLGARSAIMTDDIEGVEAQATDIAFLANYAQTLPQADMSKVAAAGFSWGGMANVFAAARSSRIKALVSLDGSIRFHPKIWSAATYVRPARTAVPMLFLGARMPTAETMELSDKLGPSYLNTMKYSDVYVTTMQPMTHPDFSSWQLRFARDDAFGDYQRADVLQAYRSGALYVHRFLDAYLKNDATALAFLRESPARHGIGPQVMSMEFRPAKFALLGEADFLRSFVKAGYKDAQSIYSQMSAESPDFKLSPLNLNALGYQLLRGKNARGAVELFKLATFIEPKYGNAFDSEGEAYEALGEKELAIAAYEKAVAVDKRQVNAVARIKALRAGG